MGTKTTAKDMVKEIDTILKVLTQISPEQYIRDYGKIMQEIKEHLDKLTKFTYAEERVERIIKQIIERSKADLVKLIQADEAFTKDEKNAVHFLQELRQIRDQLPTAKEYNEKKNFGPVIFSNLQQLRALLVKDADIADAIQIVARDLERLLQTLRNAEK